MTDHTYEHTPAADPRTVDKDAKVVTPTEARQAEHVGLRNVLACGLALVIVAFALMYAFYF